VGGRKALLKGRSRVLVGVLGVGYTSPTQLLALSGLNSGTDGVGDELATTHPELRRSILLHVRVVAPSQVYPQEFLSPLVRHVPPSLATPEGVAAPGRNIYSAFISASISESLRWLALSSE